MNRVKIQPHRYPPFGAPEGASFCLVTHRDLIDAFDISAPGYRDIHVVTCEPGESFDALLQGPIPEPAHILVITPRRLFESPAPEILGSRRKLAVMACGSTPTPLDAIAHFLKVIERTDTPAMIAASERFFTLGESSEYLQLTDEEYGTKAIFRHLNESYEWFEQFGDLPWGGQQLVPAGELSVLPLFHAQYDPYKSPDVTGEIALRGCMILHTGRPSFLPEDQARIYAATADIEHHAVIATIEHGVIRAVRPSCPEAAGATTMFEHLFSVDSRFRSVWEIGFGINANHEVYPGNIGMNEVHGGDFGSIHWGLGLTPWTQYHMDIVCPGTRVATLAGETLIGPPPGQRASLRKVAAGIHLTPPRGAVA